MANVYRVGKPMPNPQMPL